MTIEVHNPSGLPLIDYRRVKPLQGGLKRLDPANYEKLKGVLERRGFTTPLFLWHKGHEYYLMDGHQRQTVMLGEDVEPYEVPWWEIKAKSLKDAKAQLLEITSEYGTITREGFDEFTTDLPVADILEATYFDALGYMEPDLELDPEADEAPAVDSGPPVSVQGGVYQLGPHRLACGDATSLGDVSELVDGEVMDMVWTDPPYNVDYEGKTADALKIQNDKFDSPEAFAQFLTDSLTNMQAVTRDGGAIYIAHADSEGLNFRQAMLSAGWLMKQCLVWVKNTMVLGRQDYQWQHEPILYGWKEGAAHYFTKRRDLTTVLHFDKPSRSEDHPTMKPVALVAYCLLNSSQRGAKVLDLFAGSGSTLVACHETSRVCYAMELDPRYCDVIRKRYAKLVDKEEQWQEVTPELNRTTNTGGTPEHGTESPEPAPTVAAR